MNVSRVRANQLNAFNTPIRIVQNRKEQNMMDNNTNTPPQHPLKWHKFLCYFGLWVGALFSIIAAVTIFSGAHYGLQSNVSFVYSMYGSLKIIDILFGLAYIELALYTVNTALQLMKFKANAPGKLMILYILNAVVPSAQILLTAMVTGIPLNAMIDNTFLYRIVGVILGIMITKVYYGKRIDMFVA